MGNPSRLRQILINLIGNAIKFTEEGEVSVGLKPISQTNDNYCVEFRIRDTGVGIPAEKHPYLFGKFYQVDSSITRKYGGTGLGLAISKQLVEMMGGEIGIRNPEDSLQSNQWREGAEFWFTSNFQTKLVPIDKTEDHHSTAPEALSAKTEFINLTYRFPPAHVLLVEDSNLNQKVALTILKRLGITASVANNGKEALEELKKQSFDLVLMDVQMPVMDGYEATRILRSSSFESLNRETPVIAMTAYAMKGDREKCLESGMNDYTTKPITIVSLANIIARWLGG
jgi:CheY-like chemotaxis protein